MNRNLTLVALLASVVFSVPVFALEATAANDATALSAVEMKLDAFNSVLQTALTTIVGKIDTCSKAGKLYAPTSPSQDANGCVGIAASCSFPAASTCGNGSHPVSNGSAWVCG